MIFNLLLNLSSEANKYVEDSKPWELNKQNKKDKLFNFLNIVSNVVRNLVFYLSPILKSGIKLAKEQFQFSSKDLDPRSLVNFELLNNHKVGVSKPIYERIK